LNAKVENEKKWVAQFLLDVLAENGLDQSAVERPRRLVVNTIDLVGCSHLRALALFHVMSQVKDLTKSVPA
jgi:hypothetical protein